MERTRKALAAAVRPLTPDGRLLPEHMAAFDALGDAIGLPDDSDAPPAAVLPRLDVARLQRALGVLDDGDFGTASRAALFARFTNRNAPALTASDFQRAADRLRVPVACMRAVRQVEAPRGPYDDNGRPSILYERHVADRNTDPPGRLRDMFPALYGPPYGRGGYGAFGEQWDKLAQACRYDPHAAFAACSWGAFQVLGENAEALGYPSAFDMALSLVVGEAAHLETFVRFVEANDLADELRACRPGDPDSCVPFVKVYNGPRHADFNYAPKLAAAIRGFWTR